MTEKKAKPKTYITIDGEEYETTEVSYGSQTYTLRELSVEENDEIEEASTEADGKFNGKLNLRMCLAKSILSPETPIDKIAKWPGKKYLTLSRAFNAINSLPENAAGEG